MRQEPTFDWSGFEEDEGEIRQLAPARPFSRTRLALRLAAAAAIITGLTVIARENVARPAQEAASRGWTEPPRIAARRPAPAASSLSPLLRYEAAETETAARNEAPRWSPATGQREDTLASGGFDAIEAPFLRVTLTDAEPNALPPAGLFVTLARRAAEQGLSVMRTGARGQVETKFGSFETLEATLSGEGSRLCTGFQATGERTLRLDGWLCGILGQAPEPRALACAIDRLTLAPSAGAELASRFEEAETRRDPSCRVDAVAVKRARASQATGSIASPSTDGKARGKADTSAKRNAQARP